ncbi:UNVERIFIED_CONTAM: hypothetical protein NCL1_51210 [Trichonephila clavipes]
MRPTAGLAGRQLPQRRDLPPAEDTPARLANPGPRGAGDAAGTPSRNLQPGAAELQLSWLRA